MPKSERTFPNRAALDEFFAEQSRVMVHAGFRVIRGRDFINLYPPSDSLSDGSFSTWTVVED